MKKHFRVAVMAAFALVTVYNVSCSKSQHVGTKELSAYDSISVDIDYPILPQYIKLVPYNKDGEIYATGYNYYNHSIDFVNLTGGDNFTVQLQHEGPDGVLPVQDYCFANNQIVCKDKSGILTLTMNGNVVNRLDFKTLNAPTESYSNQPPTLVYSNFLYLSNQENKVFIPLSPIKKGEDIHIGKVYDVSLKTLDFLQPSYPADIRDNAKHLSGLSIPYICQYGENKLVYNFPASSLIYTFNPQTNETEMLDVKSQTIANDWDLKEWSSLDFVKKSEKEISTSRFGRVHYNPSLQKYYRVHYTEEKEGAKQRRIYLMTFNEKTEETKEYLLPSQLATQYFYMGEFVYFACQSSNDNSFNIAKIHLGEL